VTPQERLSVAAAASDLVDVADVADLLGVTECAINYHARRPGFPRPIRRHATHRWWLLDDIIEWDAARPPRYRRRPS
jgi:predicted DNA-binding transcriptional regulator AlpA